jgi:hypothetical protein
VSPLVVFGLVVGLWVACFAGAFIALAQAVRADRRERDARRRELGPGFQLAASRPRSRRRGVA